METPPLGKLERVDDLRTVWSSEPMDFTPWLAKEDNLQQLGDTVGGLELELEGTETNVGSFSADILCKDTVNDQWVLVENPLDHTDHAHLGQLITYAAGLDAVTIVWISKDFREEHRKALDWLNEITSEGTDFFGLEIELWRIGGSPVAPKFNVVSKPNDWSRKVTTASRRDGELSELDQLYLEYWTEFSEYLEEHSQRVTPRKPLPQAWMNFAVGRSGCHLSAGASSQKNVIGVRLVLRKQANTLFHLLKQEQEVIEEEIGAALDWRPKPNAKRCGIGKQWQNEDPTVRNLWPEQHRRLADMLERFHQAFSPRLKRLNPDTYAQEEERGAEQDRVPGQQP